MPTGTLQVETTFDLDWLVEEDMPPGPYPPDSEFVFKRVPELITEVATKGSGMRALDVACGMGGQLRLLRSNGCEVWGLDASMALVRHCQRELGEEGAAPLICAVAETLPFRDNSFDRVICQGSLDHFPRPRAFLREVARVLNPDGEAIIGISNFDSLSCRLGRTLYGLKDRFGLSVYRGRNYWEIPDNHTFKGTLPVLRRLGEPHMELVECRGVSMLWLFHRWTRLLEQLPRPIAWSTLAVLDRIAYRLPQLADMLISVWRPRKTGDELL